MAKFLDQQGVATLWSKTKEKIASEINTSVINKRGAADGFATLGSDSKIPTAQLPALKTINNQSILGSGNITLDTNLYIIVSSLPTENINSNKIYLVADSDGAHGNRYREYVYVNGSWELLGEYKANIDLSGYVTMDGLGAAVADFGYIEREAYATSTLGGTINTQQFHYLSTLISNGATLVVGPVNTTATEVQIQVKDFPKNAQTSDTPDSQALVIPAASSTYAGVLTSTMFDKLDDIDEFATADEAIPASELAAILV